MFLFNLLKKILSKPLFTAIYFSERKLLANITSNPMINYELKRVCTVFIFCTSFQLHSLLVIHNRRAIETFKKWSVSDLLKNVPLQ